MDRRSFIKKGSLAAASPVFLGNMNLFPGTMDSMLSKMAMMSENDRVLVIVQLHGGNDGLNTCIPINVYPTYYNIRANVAIPQSGPRKFITLDSTLPDNVQIGLHPDMTAFKDLYDDGKLAVVQSVAYENINGSHFRGRDIFFMGGNYDDYFSSGWMGRYLDHKFPEYPDAYPNSTMPDPPSIEMGSGLSLAFHRDEGIPMGLAVQNPLSFYNLINSVGTDPLYNFPDNYHGDELRYIAEMEKIGNTYAARLREVYLAGSNSDIVYPMVYPFLAPTGSLTNPLSNQLQIIARLLDGGCKTKIFLCRIGGFDTHANQVLETDTTMGHHAALLYHLSGALKAFQQDLTNLGLQDRVMTVTLSEFGRRVYSNGGFGTDHGEAAPFFVIGDCVKAGVLGFNPTQQELMMGNIPMKVDHRQIMTSILVDWFGADSEAIDKVRFNEWVSNRLDIVECKYQSVNDLELKMGLNIFPNPTSNMLNIEISAITSEVHFLEIYNADGRRVFAENLGFLYPGKHLKNLDLSAFSQGSYFIKIYNKTQSKTLQIVLSK